MSSQAVSEYLAALERIKQNKPINIAKGSPINKDNVAKEAGRARGSIRNRPGFEPLLNAIEEAQKATTERRSAIDDKQRVKNKNTEIEMLKRENEKLKARYMSLLFLNYEMSNRLKKAGIEQPHIGEIISLEIDENLPL